MDGLERRYRQLLVAYPAGYRQRRADEIVGTLLDAAAPGQRRPSLADAADLVAGGLRQRLGPGAAADLAAGRALAGPVALALAAGLSGFLWLTVEGAPGHVTLAPAAFAAWLLALAGWVALPGRYARWPVAVAMAVTVLVLPVAVLAGAGRPPLWVVLGLLAFGALAVAGPPPDSATARAAVLTGALATAALSKALLTAQLPVTRWSTAYYHPAIALSGLIVTGAVVGLAAAAVPALLRGRPVRPWLWAVLLLALPGGWLGPRTGPVAVAGTRPGFGRLAEVLLATCVVLAAMAALTGVRAVAGGLDRAGAMALGCAAGLAGSLWWMGQGRPWAYAAWLGAALAYPVLPALGRRLAVAAALGLTATVALAPAGPPWSALVTLALLGTVPLLAPAGGAWYPLGVAVTTAAAGAVVAAYDNGWRLTGWHAFAHTGGLVLTLAIVPFAVAVVAAVRAVRSRRFAAVATLLAGTGWIGALTLPHLGAWGPVLILVPLGAVPLAVRAGRARAAARRALDTGRHAGLLALARAVCPDPRTARRLTVATLARGGQRAELVRAALDLPPGPAGDPLCAAVHALPPEERVALHLRYRAELPVPEIAALLGCSAATARGLVDRARHGVARMPRDGRGLSSTGDGVPARCGAGAVVPDARAAGQPAHRAGPPPR